MKNFASFLSISLLMAIIFAVACKSVKDEKSTGKDFSFGGNEDSLSTPGVSAPVGTTQEYMAACKDAQVPIPPVWGNSDWERKGVIRKEHVIVNSGNLETSLYVYNHSTGMCAGLGRGNPVNQLGVICTSFATGATCFWDNLTPPSGRTTVSLRNYDVSKGSGGNILKQNCTNCHRGSSPWIRLAGEPTGNANLKNSPNWYPLSLDREGWINPKGPKVGGCSAGACHAMPAANQQYCDIAELFVHQFKSMPPPKIQGTARVAMISAFDEYCKEFKR